MYEYIRGEITEIESNSVIIENNNIGYIVYVSNPYSYELNKEYKIYTYTYIREDECTLYGFKNKEDKSLFLKLINVKGLGPKMVMPIIATSSQKEITEAIENEDINYLKKFPKIGDKVAKQIILDLKGKICTNNNKKSKNESISKELEEVLLGFGYKKTDINKIKDKINMSEPLENQIKASLKLLLK